MPYREQAAVMFTDVVGFTSVMEQSENEAMRILSRKMRVVRKVITGCRGRLVKEMGDGTLSVFPSAPDAVSSAMSIQKDLEDETFKIRIGVHFGSVLFEGDDIFGDTVNVASRLEQKSPGGGILVSREVLSRFKDKKRPESVNLGLTRLKGLGRLLQIHFLGRNSLTPKRDREVSQFGGTGPVVLSVFPLVNNGGPEDEFYAYGISADLLSNLSKAKSISVVPVTSLLRSMNSGESHEDIARRFGSSILVKGTIERTGSQMKLSLTLKETEPDRVVWSDSWIEDIDDLPVIKGKLADGILKALGRNPEDYPGVSSIEVRSVSTYEKYLQALHLWETRKNIEQIHQARVLLEQVIRREPEMIPARVLLGTTYRNLGEYSTDMDILQQAREIAHTTSNRSGLLYVLRSMGISHWMKGELDEAQQVNTKAMALAKELDNRTEESSLLNNMGLIDCDRSHFSKSLIKLQRSLDMSRDMGSRTGQAHSLCNIGLVHWRSGDGSKALEFYKQSLEIVKIIGDQSGEANLLTNMGIIYNDRGEMELAYDTVSRSMGLSQVLGDQRAVCRAMNNMGSAMLALGVFEKAEEHFSQAITLARKIGLRNMEGLLLTNSAILRIQAGDLRGAEKLLEESLILSGEVDDKEGIVENKLYLADILLSRNDFKNAVNHQRDALTLSEKFKMTRVIASIKTNLALTLIMSDEADIEEVGELLREAQTAEIENEKSLPEIYWKWSGICSGIAKSFSNEQVEKNKFLEESAKWKSAARTELLQMADKIKSEEFRNSFLYQISWHKTIMG
ncbi:MAG: tetratricopeptide repeat protein [Candidatus Sabulitectum sp.]|nr:tetratricopeptide repeat protein [Candidatus Sabulitectum sp.]